MVSRCLWGALVMGSRCLDFLCGHPEQLCCAGG